MNGPDRYPGMDQAIAERNELTRQAAQRTLDRVARGESVDADHVQWCRDFVAQVKPLGRPLSDGQPRVMEGS